MKNGQGYGFPVRTKPEIFIEKARGTGLMPLRFEALVVNKILTSASRSNISNNLTPHDPLPDDGSPFLDSSENGFCLFLRSFSSALLVSRAILRLAGPPYCSCNRPADYHGSAKRRICEIMQIYTR